MAFLDDYAFLADAILELCTVRFDADALRFGGQLLDALLEHFSDARSGGFWFTADDHETLITRSRSFSDDALPSGNGVAALEECLHPPQLVILRGRRTDIEAWGRQLAKLYAPRRVVLAVPADAADLPDAIASKPPRPDRISAYVCRGSVCSAPLHTLQLLAAELAADYT